MARVMKTNIDGIVLYSKYSGESDVISKVLTGEYGIIDILFKGIKKSTRRPNVATETGVLSSFTFNQIYNDRSSIPNEIHVIDAHTPIREDIAKISYMNFISEMVLKTNPSYQSDEYLFKLMKAVLTHLETTNENEYLALFFVLRLFLAQGILPNFSSCGICGSNSDKIFHFSIKDKSIICPICARIPSKDFIKNTYKQRFFIKTAISNKYGSFDKHIISINDSLNLLFHLVLYIESYLGIDIITKSFVFSNNELHLIDKSPININLPYKI
jgi:DNA repair protein RecO (recombination protein O)